MIRSALDQFLDQTVDQAWQLINQVESAAKLPIASKELAAGRRNGISDQQFA
ncbi:hypothetical protein J40TS1_41080 [Paenibacillus montaniterrae]|uniref:Uncharacterized protein n=1 Tax=Paenibacillus montaniterrae TaxID=429341 RepID=A0A919YU22_9BACL|nr:hypothetical protein J40TS1_41080 [Paenibacillus montaniterrae]